MADIVRRGKRKDVTVTSGAALITTHTRELPVEMQTSPGFVLFDRVPSYVISVRGRDGYEDHTVFLSESEMLDTVEKWLAAFNERRHKNGQ